MVEVRAGQHRDTLSVQLRLGRLLSPRRGCLDARVSARVLMSTLVQVRGTGLLVGIQMKAAVTPVVEARRRRDKNAYLDGFPVSRPVGVQQQHNAVLPVSQEARKRGLLVITAGAGDIVRLVPPLTITSEEVEKCATILAGAINDVMK